MSNFSGSPGGIQRLTTLIEQSPDMLGRYSPDGLILWASPQSAAVLGYTPGELQGRSTYDFVLPEDAGALRAAHLELLHGSGHLDVAYRIIHRDGTQRWVHSTGSAIHSPETGEPLEILCGTRDITRLRRAERHAASAERLAASLLRHLPASAFVISLDHRYLFVNPYWEKAVGRSNNEVAGQSFSAVWPPEVAARLVDLGEQVVRTGAAVELEQAFKLPSGIRQFRSVRFPLQDDSGAITATAGVSLDVTAAHELQLRRNEADKLGAVGRLAGGIAHEFNNELTVLLGYAQLIQQPATTPETARRYAAAIESAAQESALLVRHLLAFGGRFQADPKPLDLGGEARRHEPLLRSLLGPRIAVNFEIGPAPVHADPAQIELILRSLSMHALKSMPSGGSLTLRIFSNGDFSVIEAADSSPGLTPLNRAQLFEPLHQLRTGGEPLALELSSAYGTVRQLGGDIDVATPPGGGVTFTIRLPRRLLSNVCVH